LHFLGVEAVILSQSQKQLPSEKLAFIGEKYADIWAVGNKSKLLSERAMQLSSPTAATGITIFEQHKQSTPEFRCFSRQQPPCHGGYTTSTILKLGLRLSAMPSCVTENE